MTSTSARPPLLVAHRGDPVRERENTLAAIRRARTDGAEVIEVDVRLSAEGTVVLLHDASTARLWGVDRPVRTQRDAELPEGVPTLRAALEAADGARLLIDVPEDEEDDELARAAVAVARAWEGPAPAFCGHEPAVRGVREADPTAEIWLTWAREELLDEDTLEEILPSAWNPPHHLVDAASIAHARSMGLTVTCWTVDDLERARELTDLGVEAITSNRAGELRRALRGSAG